MNILLKVVCQVCLIGEKIIKTKLNDNDINEQNIKKFLEKLKKSIDSNIIPLYDNGYILGNINLENISLDYFKNVYFDNQKKYHYTNKDKVIQIKNENVLYYYPFLLHNFLEIDKDINFVSKKWLIDIFTNKIHFNILYIEIFKNLDDKEIYKLDTIYDTYILPIVRNIDIYELSKFINNIFYIVNGSKKKFLKISNDTYYLINTLTSDALLNKINGPRELSIRLQAIIDSINL